MSAAVQLLYTVPEATADPLAIPDPPFRFVEMRGPHRHLCRPTRLDQDRHR
jgi:hypothetical protein